MDEDAPSVWILKVGLPAIFGSVIFLERFRRCDVVPAATGCAGLDCDMVTTFTAEMMAENSSGDSFARIMTICCAKGLKEAMVCVKQRYVRKQRNVSGGMW